MSEFFLDEAMGANRVANINQQNMLLNAGQDDSAYDNFFADRPDIEGAGRQRSDTVIERLPDGQDGDDHDAQHEIDQGEDEVVRVEDDDDDYQTAQDHQSEAGGNLGVGGGGLIEEEQSQAPLIERRPSVNYSTESNMVGPWMPRSRNPARAGQARSNNVMGKYWRTFGERQSAIGGGLGGFFGALFGRGMKRANALAGARARRAAERANVPLELNSALRTRLQNEGSARADDIKNYPREPGIKVNHRAALKTRKTFDTASSVFWNIDDPSAFDAKDLGLAHGEYDLSTGTRSQPLDATVNSHTTDKFTAISQANDRWGEAAAEEIVNPHVPKARLRNAAGVDKRVRFMDGANSEAGPVPREPDDIDPKPRPTGVKFHPIPLIGASREGMTWKQRRAVAARERSQGLTDDQALAQEQAVWPVRNRLNRMDADRLEVTMTNAGVQAEMMRRQNPAPDSPEAAQIQDLHLTSELGGDVASTRMQENNERSRKQHSHFETKGLNKFQQMTVMQELMSSGDRRWAKLDPTKYLEEQMPHVPARYFKNRYWNAFDARMRQDQPGSDSVVGEDASDAGADVPNVIGNDGGGGAGGGGGLIQEEPDQVQQQMPQPHEAWHVLQQK